MISIAGDLLSEVCVPVDSALIERFSAAYEKWKSGDESCAGTRLQDWGEAAMTPRLIRDLADLRIGSVEDLAAVSDAHLPRIIDGRSWRAKAVAWVAAHPSREEEGEIAQLKAQNRLLTDRLVRLEKALPSRKARKPARKAARKKLPTSPIELADA